MDFWLYRSPSIVRGLLIFSYEMIVLILCLLLGVGFIYAAIGMILEFYNIKSKSFHKILDDSEDDDDKK